MPDMTPAERNGQADSSGSNPDARRLAIPKKLLVIDDEPGICTVIARVAASLGLGTRVVHEPSNAADAFVDFAPDLVLLDMIMPGKDGVDLLHEMLLTGVPSKFILMSGYGETFMRLAIGVATFHGVEPPATLSKPFRRDELVTMIRTTLRLDAGASPYGPLGMLAAGRSDL